MILKPSRGGFMRPFGCGYFISEFLAGHGPYDSPIIDPAAGAPQADIFHHYKMALIRATAFDRASGVEEKMSRRSKRPLSPDIIDKLAQEFMAHSKYKATGCRYHSFVVYFSTIKKLGWVEPTGMEEPSALQANYAAGQPRKYYRLMEAGRQAGDAAWANPHLTLYGGHN